MTQPATHSTYLRLEPRDLVPGSLYQLEYRLAGHRVERYAILRFIGADILPGRLLFDGRPEFGTQTFYVSDISIMHEMPDNAKIFMNRRTYAVNPTLPPRLADRTETEPKSNTTLFRRVFDEGSGISTEVSLTFPMSDLLADILRQQICATIKAVTHVDVSPAHVRVGIHFESDQRASFDSLTDGQSVRTIHENTPEAFSCITYNTPSGTGDVGLYVHNAAHTD